VSARVTAEQIWASRRLVTIVLPLVALFAARAAAGLPGSVAGWRTQVARFCVVVGVVLGVLGLAPTAGRSLQAGGADLAGRVAAALPDDAMVVVAKPLDWTHVAASLWLDHGRTTLVVREHPGFATSLAALLERDSRRHFSLSGAVVEVGDEIDPAALQPVVPPGYAPREIEHFDWELEMLETTQDHAPRERLLRRAVLVLYELERVDSLTGLR
jgi:hypothetical protein